MSYHEDGGVGATYSNPTPRENYLEAENERLTARLSAVEAERDGMRRALEAFDDCSIAGGRAFDETKLYAAWRLAREFVKPKGSERK